VTTTRYRADIALALDDTMGHGPERLAARITDELLLLPARIGRAEIRVDLRPVHASYQLGDGLVAFEDPRTWEVRFRGEDAPVRDPDGDVLAVTATLRAPDADAAVAKARHALGFNHLVRIEHTREVP
jgi:hypothetical protein